MKKKKLVEKDLLIMNKQDIEETNHTLFCWVSCIGITCFTLLHILSYVIPSYASMKIAYALVILILVGNCLLHHVFEKRFSVRLFLYCSYGLLALIVTYTSAFVTYSSSGALILLLLFQIPIVIIDESRRVNVVECMIAALYLFAVILNKNRALVIDECINVVTTTLIAIVLGSRLRRAQLSNFELKRLAIENENTDTLTKLYNRRRLFNDLSENGQTSRTVAILMMDIDDFKAYNDTYGHQAGDCCLQQVGQCLMTISKQEHVTFYRYGGEEFVGIALDYEVDGLQKLCNMINQQICDLHISHSKNDTGVVTMSIGYENQFENKDYEKKLFRADLALYHAKHRGKNISAKYQETMSMDYNG